MRRVISFFNLLIFPERAARRGGAGGGGEGAAILFFFPVQQTTSGIGHRVKVVFFGLATNALNVRNNNNNNNNCCCQNDMCHRSMQQQCRVNYTLLFSIAAKDLESVAARRNRPLTSK